GFPAGRTGLLGRTLEIRSLGAGHGARLPVHRAGLFLGGGRLALGARCRGTARSLQSGASSRSDLCRRQRPGLAADGALVCDPGTWKAAPSVVEVFALI